MKSNGADLCHFEQEIFQEFLCISKMSQILAHEISLAMSRSWECDKTWQACAPGKQSRCKVLAIP